MTALGKTLRETTLVLAMGLGIGLVANALNDDGLSLTRDYFPTRAVAPPQSAPATTAAAAPEVGTDRSVPEPPADGEADPASEVPAVTVTPAAAEQAADAPADEVPPSAMEIDPAVAARLAEKGLAAIGHDEVVALWEDPLYELGAYAFIDARREDAYAEGHIPGAWHFDPFYPERHLDEVLGVLAASQTVVIYCRGGECDDSENAALNLMPFAPSPESVVIYTGGILAWMEAGLDLERGARGSGDIVGGGDGS